MGRRIIPKEYKTARIKVDSTEDFVHLAYCTQCDWRYLGDDKTKVWQVGGEHLHSAHGLVGRLNHAQNTVCTQRKRAKDALADSRFDKGIRICVAPPAANGEEGSEADLAESTTKTYPQIHAHVDNL